MALTIGNFFSEERKGGGGASGGGPAAGHAASAAHGVDTSTNQATNAAQSTSPAESQPATHPVTGTVIPHLTGAGKGTIRKGGRGGK